MTVKEFCSLMENRVSEILSDDFDVSFFDTDGTGAGYHHLQNISLAMSVDRFDLDAHNVTLNGYGSTEEDKTERLICGAVIDYYDAGLERVGEAIAAVIAAWENEYAELNS